MDGTPGERRDLDKTIPGPETEAVEFAHGCRDGGSSELWTINGGSHVPEVSEIFGQQVVEWLYEHPKTN